MYQVTERSQNLKLMFSHGSSFRIAPPLYPYQTIFFNRRRLHLMTVFYPTLCLIHHQTGRFQKIANSHQKNTITLDFLDYGLAFAADSAATDV